MFLGFIKIYERRFSIKTKYTKFTIANGTWLECKTAEIVSLIGEELDLLIIDEAARIAPMVYERELAATTMSRKGRTIFISSPKGKNWFYNKYKSIEKNENGFVWNAPSSDNPKNSPEELERIKNTLPEAIWKQEYLAQFVDSGATVFRNYRNCIRECFAKPKAGRKYSSPMPGISGPILYKRLRSNTSAASLKIILSVTIFVSLLNSFPVLTL